MKKCLKFSSFLETINLDKKKQCIDSKNKKTDLLSTKKWLSNGRKKVHNFGPHLSNVPRV